ncbi:MAG: VWA domain-containing protein [Deltaproteobacteria bacterium]|nr:VWA domain-containing protein [Deltaproteobacteria bacterium]
MKNKLMCGSMVRWALPAACLALGLACAQADVDGAAGGNGKGGNGAGASNGSGATGGFTLGGFSGTLMGVPTEGGQGCNDTSVKFERTIPTVALVIDRSSSMTTTYGTGNRWDVLKQVLLNPDPKLGVLKSLEGEIRFGLAMYTSILSEPTCPMLGSVDFALGNFDAINAVYGPATTPNGKGETPTAETIRAVTDKLVAIKEQGPKYILLATDGEPDGCGPVRDPNCGQDESVAAVADAYSKGIKTFVVAIGNEVGQDHLQALANVGQGLQPILGQMKYDWLRYSCNIAPANLKGKYADLAKDPNSQEIRVMAPAQPPANATAYRPDDPAGLARDLQKVIGTVRDCKFRLKGEVEMNRAPEGLVAIDGMPVKYNEPDGWKLNSATEVELLGAACSKIQSDDSKGVFISFPCGVFNPD